jgi:hypothetical protein
MAAMLPGEIVHPGNVVDILEVTGMRMSVLQSGSKASVYFIRVLNPKSFQCRGGAFQRHINIRTDEFMLRPLVSVAAVFGDRYPKGKRDTIFLTDTLRT